SPGRHRRMASLPRLVHARHDDAAPHLRLLLANAAAEDRLWIGGHRCADHASQRDGRGWRDRHPWIEALRGGCDMKPSIILLAAIAVAGTGAAVAQQKPTVSPARVDQVMRDSFKSATPEWQQRLVQDQTMKECTATRNQPSAAQADAIMAREKAIIVYPADGKFIGDWKKGEKLAQSGYGLRFSDYPPTREN